MEINKPSLYDWLRYITDVISHLYFNVARNCGLITNAYYSQVSLRGKTAVITGSNRGIGYETALDLAKRGAKVYMGCRDVNKGQEAAEKIISQSGNELIIVQHLNLSDLNSVRIFARQIASKESQIDILVNNAGIVGYFERSLTCDGFENCFGNEYLSHCLLTLMLMQQLIKSNDARIITLCSMYHRIGIIHFNDINLTSNYKFSKAKSQSNLAKVLFNRELAKRLKRANYNNVRCYCVSPGIAATFSHTIEIMKTFKIKLPSIVVKCLQYLESLFYSSPYEGAQTTIYCIVDDDAGRESGFYYQECHRSETSINGRSDILGEKLWNMTCDLINIKQNCI